MKKNIMKYFAIVMTCMFAVITLIAGIFYMNDFRYNSECGLYYISVRGSDYTEEEREERRISEGFECRVIHLEDCPGMAIACLLG